MKSTCDICSDPGACCKGFSLNRDFPYAMPSKEIAKHVHEGTSPWNEEITWPAHPQLQPIHKEFYYCSRGHRKPHSVRWSFSCGWLDENGRCSNYENRPEFCKTFEPKSDLLCIEYNGSFKGRLINYQKAEKK